MFEIPVAITLDGVEYPIRNKGDYRMVLDCFSALNDPELDVKHRILTSLIIFYDGLDEDTDIDEFFHGDVDSAIREMYLFFNCGQPENHTKRPNLMDWEKDGQLIASAINNVAKTEIRFEPYVHWWTFMGYYMSIGESAFSTVVGIRYKIKSGKKLEKHEKEFKRDNPQYFVWDTQSVEDKQLTDYVRSLWNNGG